jgi:uncharacterized protein YmfQ (DUF2313 family)
MLALTPPGDGLPKAADSNWGIQLLPQATEISRLEAEAEEMFSEIDPRQTYYLLPEWEAEFGPDPYGVVTSGFNTAQMQAYLYQRLTRLGGQSVGYFIALAALFGVTITITEYQQFVYDQARYGAARYVNTPQQFVWTVNLPNSLLVAACYGSARYGDRYSSFVPNPVAAIIAAQAPAHTQPIFSYTG